MSQSLGKSKRTIERAIQFAKQYPDLNELPEGKNTSWYQICSKYLSDSPRWMKILSSKETIWYTPRLCIDAVYEVMEHINLRLLYG